MNDSNAAKNLNELEPVKGGAQAQSGAVWGERLLWFLRAMAVVSMLSGLRLLGSGVRHGVRPAGRV